ncbi:hypothetical protein [Brevibacillus aydinogluensis]|uniref:Uncharacterized protein n=1 Tax=Brevibacillus aydinogluensis TaxID=927786 RepID=A0AA48M8U6_9BACL|nr:hypothetical protein [Brevibacillus aydinogluensis]CAJ1003388.1 hypothetical protein BSPP4475_13805 [Brevibacillus aydinogluensis]
MRNVLIVTLFLCSALLWQPLQTATAAPPSELQIVVSVGPNADFLSTLSIRQKNGLAQIILRSPIGPASPLPNPSGQRSPSAPARFCTGMTAACTTKTGMLPCTCPTMRLLSWIGT